MKRVLVFIVLMVVLSLNSAEVFIVNSSSETLSKVDTETGLVVNNFATLGLYANRIVVNEDYGYAVNSGDNTVQKIELNSGVTTDTIVLEAGCNPYDITFDENFNAYNYAFVSGLLTNKVYKINLDDNTVVGELMVGAGPAGMTVSNGKLYVACSGSYPDYTDASVVVIEATSFELEITIPVSANAQYVTAINGMIHVVCSSAWGSNTGEINILDPDSNTITHTVSLGGYLGPIWNSSNGKAYVADGNNAGLYAYDPADYSAIYTFNNSFSTAGSLVSGTDSELFIVDSVWGSNGVLKVFNLNEEFQVEYTLGLAPTDIKVRPSSTSNEDVVNPNLKVDVYPNPFTNKLTVSSKSKGSVDFACYDIRGRKVLVSKATNSKNTINTNSLPSGVYFYKVSENGNQISTGKLLKIK
jgi:streptogramin lyase